MRSTFAVLLVGALVIAVPAQDAGKLEWQFKPGQSHKYVFKHKEIRTVEVGDLKAETTTNAEFDWLWTVQDVSAGVANIEVKLNSLRFSSAGMNFDYSYDSTRGNLGDDDYHKRLIGLLDQFRYAGKYTLRLDTTGKLLEVKGLSKVIEENNPGMNIIDYHGLNLRDEPFTFFLQEAMGRLPSKGNDKKWQFGGEHSLGDLGTASGNLTFERALKADPEGLVTIRWQGSRNANLDGKWINVDMKGTLTSSKLSGTMRFDPKAGCLHSGSATIVLGGDIKIGSGMLKMTYQHELELTKQP